jgi:hypothetical protein
MDFSHLVRFSGEKKNSFRHRCFSGINVSDYTDIARAGYF